MDAIYRVIIPYSGSVENALISSWHVDEGAFVTEGDLLAEVSTDKTETELYAPASGRLVRHLVAADTEVDVGTAVALLAAADATPEQISEALAAFDAGTLEPPISGA